MPYPEDDYADITCGQNGCSATTPCDSCTRGRQAERHHVITSLTAVAETEGAEAGLSTYYAMCQLGTYPGQPTCIAYVTYADDIPLAQRLHAMWLRGFERGWAGARAIRNARQNPQQVLSDTVTRCIAQGAPVVTEQREQADPDYCEHGILNSEHCAICDK